MDSPYAVVAGHICLDIFPGLEHLPLGGFKKAFEAGQLLTVESAVIATGGPVSNTGLALHMLGISTRLMGKVGADLFGNAVQEFIQSYSPDLVTGMVVDPKSNTSYTVILSFPGEDRLFIHYPGANDTYGVEDIDYPMVAQADLFHFGYPPVMRRMYTEGGRELAEIFRLAKAANLALSPLTSLDMTFPDPATPGGQADWRQILQRVLPHVDVFLPSIEELFYMLHRDQYDALAVKYQARNIAEAVSPDLLHRLSGELIEMGVKITVIKLGEHGLYLRTAQRETLEPLAGHLDISAWGGKEFWAPCFQVKVAGTTGAGDATIAGFLSGLLRGLPPTQAMTMAVAVGACNVETVDALSGICSWEDTEARVRAGWPRRSLKLDAPGWEWDPLAGLWVSEG
jgi:sugar/nucleoside kinase (ribokinase family)